MKKFLTILTFILICVLTLGVFSACGDNKKEGFSFYAPDGAPALSVAKFIFDKENFGSELPFSYHVVSTTDANVENTILKEGGDFVVMPLNTATKLYKNNGKEEYKLVSVLTHGNFYIMSKTAVSSINDLKGKVIYVPQRGKVPDLTLQAALKRNNIEYVEGDTPTLGKITLNYTYVAPNNIVPLLIKGVAEFGLIPEPAATTLSSKGVGYALNLQTLYDETDNAYPQAVLLAKKSVCEKYKDVIEKIANAYSENAEWVKNNTGLAIETVKNNYSGSTLPDAISPSAIEGCNFYWQDASSAKTSVQKYIERIRGINADFINEVENAFYM